MPKVNPDMITIVIIEPTFEFSTSGFTWPLRGSKYQKKALLVTTKAAPRMMENISKSSLLPSYEACGDLAN
jgi:hypothetical protein